MTPLLLTRRRFIAWLISLIAAPAVVKADRPTLVYYCNHPYIPLYRCPRCAFLALRMRNEVHGLAPMA